MGVAAAAAAAAAVQVRRGHPSVVCSRRRGRDMPACPVLDARSIILDAVAFRLTHFLDGAAEEVHRAPFSLYFTRSLGLHRVSIPSYKIV